MGTTISYKDHLMKRLQDHAEMTAYLNATLEDDDPRVFLLALQDAIEAKGGIEWLAKETEVNCASLHSTLSFDRSPCFANMIAIFQALGLVLHLNTPRTSGNK